MDGAAMKRKAKAKFKLTKREVAELERCLSHKLSEGGLEFWTECARLARVERGARRRSGR